MTVTIIVAQSLNGVIGRDGDIPWHLPTDMAFFRKMTEGHIVVMGRKTFESIGRPLPNRRNMVLSRRLGIAGEGAEFFPSIEALEDDLKKTRRPTEDVYVIGGEGIYAAFLKKASAIYLTLVEAVVEGDAFFPRLEGAWDVTLLHEHRQRPERVLKGDWFPHRMYRISPRQH